MAKIEIKAKNPNLSISIDIDDLCDVLVKLPMEQRIHIINHILECFGGKESPLKALAKQRYKNAIKEVKVFKDLSSNPDMPAKEAYKSVAEKYEKEADIWKQLVDLENENK
jgi:hypothetical protein